MPSESLLADLDGLRETYSQRQKAMNSLMSALKATATAASKATRSLRDFADQSADGDGALAAAQTAFAPGSPVVQLKDEVVDPLSNTLRRRIKTTSAVETALR